MYHRYYILCESFLLPLTSLHRHVIYSQAAHSAAALNDTETRAARAAERGAAHTAELEMLRRELSVALRDAAGATTELSARADALKQELAATATAADARSKSVATLESERAELRAALARLQGQLAQVRASRLSLHFMRIRLTI